MRDISPFINVLPCSNENKMYVSIDRIRTVEWIFFCVLFSGEDSSMHVIESNEMRNFKGYCNDTVYLALSSIARIIATIDQLYVSVTQTCILFF